MWAGVSALIAFGRDHVKLPLDYSKYQPWEALARISGFRFIHKEFCIVSEKPIELHLDDQGRGHCEDGPYIRWADGTGIYMWHGTVAPAEWFHSKLPSAADAVRWDNMEQRRVACEMIGWETISEQLDTTSINKDADPEIGELVEMLIPDIGREKFLRVLCGTGRKFMLPVPPEMSTALQAQAWINNVPENIIRTLEVRT